MASRLNNLRNLLAVRFSDLARTYKFVLTSPTISKFGATAFIQSVTHPYFNFENVGDYQGYIQTIKKPSEVNITFLEDDHQAIGMMLEYWNQKKYNKETNIVNPKAYYAEDATLTYLSSNLLGSFPQKEVSQGIKKAGNITNEVSKAAVDVATNVLFSILEKVWELVLTSTFTFKGFYPVMRDTVNLSYADNGVVTYNVTFNVDDISHGNRMMDLYLANETLLGVYTAIMGAQDIPILGDIASDVVSKTRG